MTDRDDLFGRDSASATPLDEDEKDGLLLSWVATRDDLNRAEQANIAKARLAVRRRRLSVETVLSDRFAKRLHRDMFGDVWRWAGQYRATERNIGIAPWDVAVSVRDLMADASLWTTGDNPMEADEAAVRLHHRLVWIHPFANGNGRHSREMADVLVRCLGQPAFTWGSRRLVDPSDTRQQYLTALRAADRGNYEPLVRFVRT